jgi:hypothetical protein
MGFESQLKLGYVFAGNTFIMESIEFAPDNKGIEVIEPNGEEHLTVSQ